MNIYVRNAILVGIGLLLFTPLIVTPSTFFPYIVGKAFFFRVMTGVLLILWTWLVLNDRSYLPKWKSPIFITFALLLVTTLLSALFGVDTTRSVWSNFERMEGWITYVHLFVLFVVLWTVMRKDEWWVRLFHGFAGIGVWVSIIAFSEFAGGNTRPDATLGNSTYLAGYLLFSIFFVLLLSWRRYKTKLGAAGFKALLRDWVSWAYAVVLAIQVWALFLTQTRGTLLGLLGGIGVSFGIIAIWGKGYKRARSLSIGILVALVAIVGLFIAFKDSTIVQETPVLDRFADISLTEGTAASRLTLWKMVGEAWKEKPILGWGQGNFLYAFAEYYDPSLYDHEPWFDRSHNVFFDWLISTGIVGLLLFLSLLVSGLVLLWRSKADLIAKSLLTGLLAGYIIHNMFVFDVLTTLIPLVFLLAYISCLRYSNLEKKEEPLIQISGSRVALGGIATVVLFVGVWMLNMPWYAQSQNLLSTLRATAQQNIPSAIAFAEKTFGRHPVGNIESVEQVSQLLARVARADNTLSPDEQNLVQMTLVHLNNEVEERPGFVRPVLFAGMMLHAFNNPLAIDYLEEARNLAPDKQAVLFQLADAYFTNDRNEEGVEVSRHAYEVAPDYAEARMRYAAALIRTGDVEGGEALLEEEDHEKPHPILVLAYVEAHRYDRAIEILHTLQQNDPDNGQIYISLAAAYRDVGRLEQAIAVLRTGIENAPNMKEQFEAIIESLENL